MNIERTLSVLVINESHVIYSFIFTSLLFLLQLFSTEVIYNLKNEL